MEEEETYFAEAKRNNESTDKLNVYTNHCHNYFPDIKNPKVDKKHYKW